MEKITLQQLNKFSIQIFDAFLSRELFGQSEGDRIWHLHIENKYQLPLNHLTRLQMENISKEIEKVKI